MSRSQAPIGRHVVITGGSQGIGEQLAVQWAAQGATVSIIARNADRLAAVAERTGAAWAAADVTDEAGLDAAVTGLVDRQGPVDVAVACAGLAVPRLFGDATSAEFRTQVEVNYLGAVHVTRSVWASMIARKSGHLVYVSSVAGLVGVPGYTGYAPTKWALRGFAESLRYEAAPHGVTVSVAYPPDTDTPGFEVENRTKPAATVAVSGDHVYSPAKVAEVIVRGVAARRPDIPIEFQGAALLRGGGLVAPAVRRYLAHLARGHL